MARSTVEVEAAQPGHRQARSRSALGMRASAEAAISIFIHQQGSLEPDATAHEFGAPQAGQ